MRNPPPPISSPITVCLHCSGLFLRVSALCSLWWELTGKALAPGNTSTFCASLQIVNNRSYSALILDHNVLSLFLVLCFSFQSQLPESVGSCLWCIRASCPAEGAVGLLYWPVVQGHRERSQFYLSLAVFGVNYFCLNWTDLQWSYFRKEGLLHYYVAHLTQWHCWNYFVAFVQIPTWFLFSLCRNGRLSELWGLWTFSASKLM